MFNFLTRNENATKTLLYFNDTLYVLTLKCDVQKFIINLNEKSRIERKVNKTYEDKVRLLQYSTVLSHYVESL